MKNSVVVSTTMPKDDMCPVCLEGEATAKNPLVMLKRCRHIFHKFCIDEWTRKHNTCPLCRTMIFTDQLVLMAGTRILTIPADQRLTRKQLGGLVKDLNRTSISQLLTGGRPKVILSFDRFHVSVRTKSKNLHTISLRAIREMYCSDRLLMILVRRVNDEGMAEMTCHGFQFPSHEAAEQALQGLRTACLNVPRLEAAISPSPLRHHQHHRHRRPSPPSPIAPPSRARQRSQTLPSRASIAVQSQLEAASVIATDDVDASSSSRDAGVHSETFC